MTTTNNNGAMPALYLTYSHHIKSLSSIDQVVDCCNHSPYYDCDMFAAVYAASCVPLPSLCYNNRYNSISDAGFEYEIIVHLDILAGAGAKFERTEALERGVRFLKMLVHDFND